MVRLGHFFVYLMAYVGDANRQNRVNIMRRGSWALRPIWGYQPPTHDVTFSCLWETRSGTGSIPSIPEQVVNACFTLYRRMQPQPLWLLDCSPFCSSIKVFYRWMFRFDSSSFRCPAWSIVGSVLSSWTSDWWERSSLFRSFDSVRDTITVFLNKAGILFYVTVISQRLMRPRLFIMCSWSFLGGHAQWTH